MFKVLQKQACENVSSSFVPRIYQLQWCTIENSIESYQSVPNGNKDHLYRLEPMSASPVLLCTNIEI